MVSIVDAALRVVGVYHWMNQGSQLYFRLPICQNDVSWHGNYESRLREPFATSSRVERTAGDIPRLASKLDRDARIHDAVHLYHYKLEEVGEYLGLHFSTVSAIAKLLEVENVALTSGTCKSCKSLILFVSEGEP
jgi:hypothetical protein